MNIQDILELLPHRYPFLLVDKVIEYVPDFSLVAIKNVTINEPFFPGHFPVRAVMPGVLIVEALAQAAGILASQTEEWQKRKPLFYLAGIESARFKKVVVPGDQLYLNVELIKRKAGIWKFKGTALVDGQVVCTAEMTSAEVKGEA